MLIQTSVWQVIVFQHEPNYGEIHDAFSKVTTCFLLQGGGFICSLDKMQQELLANYLELEIGE